MSENHIKVTINGQVCKAERGQMLIEVADQNGIKIPRFCYHKKLSIAANCRMCFVEVEKAPKALPACATPINDGMVVYTQSEKAITGQKATMEFLLINHPLDCPVCDQGGECELQDLAMGYGSDVSRYVEAKRVVMDKNIGPLIATDMTRCIHCTRCVRFGEEIAGLAEMGGTGRGEHMEIGTYIEKSVTSEVSGNVIDLCPVGALTAKPSRYTSRPWELLQYPSVAAHDCVGSNIYAHVRSGELMRIVPRENEIINETWISDRDRFSYEAVSSVDRLTSPMVKIGGEWKTVDWETALLAAAKGLKSSIKNHGAETLAGLISPSSSTEEMYLLQKIIRALGSNNIDHRLRQLDFSDQQQAPAMPWLGQRVADLDEQGAILLIGSNIRKEQPILAVRLRRAALKGTRISSINPRKFENNFPMTAQLWSSPQHMLVDLAAIVLLLAEQTKQPVPQQLHVYTEGVTPNEQHQAIAESLVEAGNKSILLGALSEMHPSFAALRAMASVIASLSGASLGYLSAGANAAGAWLSAVVPHRDVAGKALDSTGKNALEMLSADSGIKAALLFAIEPDKDCIDPLLAVASLKQMEHVVAFTAYSSDTLKSVADVLLPIGTHFESSGTLVNAEGYWQSYKGVAKPLGNSRPAWKVLKVLADSLSLHGFDYLESTQVRDELKEACRALQLDNSLQLNGSLKASPKTKKLMRIGEVAIYSSDALVRHAASLQQTEDALCAFVSVNSKQAEAVGCSDGDKVNVRQGDAAAVLSVKVTEDIPAHCAWIPAGLAETSGLGPLFGEITMEKV